MDVRLYPHPAARPGRIRRLSTAVIGDFHARLVTASLDVVRGAFRFTTGIFGRHAAGRDVKIRISTVTAGIRGARRGGRYFVTTSVSADQKPALDAYLTLRAAGYPAVVRPIRKDDGSFEYRVGVPNLATQQDADATAAKLKALGMPDAAGGR